jgi:DNA-binding transcriptional LysR family regulator
MSDPRPTLDQLQVFQAIVEAGSFAGAARRLGRATSVVSYTIANLEAQLGLELFDRDTTRKPSLTEAGKAILGDTRTITMGVGGLLAKAKGLHSGLEAEVTLVVDVMLPPCGLVQVLDAFRMEFPTVSLRLYVETLGAVTQRVLDGTADIGVSGPLDHADDGLQRSQIGAVRLIPVAAPSHPLARMGDEADAHARDHIQLVLTDRSNLTEGRDFQVIALKSWRLADFGAKHALLRGGIGWGSMPEEVVREDIEKGLLVRLNVTAWDNAIYRLQGIHRTDTPPGPAGRWLLEKFKTVLGGEK